jgi:AraC-like DNA-binding protein
MSSERSVRMHPTIYRTYTPPPPLANFVDSLWLYENYRPAHTKERRLPDGSMELVINLREDAIRLYDPQQHDRFCSTRGSVISGPHTEYVVLDTASQSSMMGAHFKPGGAFPFLNLPAAELRDETVSLDILWGITASELRDQLREAQTPEARFHILEQSLLAHLARPLTRHPAVAFALKEFQNTAQLRMVSDVTTQIGLSPKRFISLFSQEVGLTPKLFCRIRRFQEALQRIRSGGQVEWTEIALSCGYFDQAHFIHDFQAFSGLNPSSYLRDQGEHRNHVPLPD